MRPLLSHTLAVAIAASAVYLAAATEPPTASASSSARSKACDVRGSRTVRRTRDIRIFRRKDTIYGCHYDNGRSYALVPDRRGTVGDEPYHLRLAGPYAGYHKPGGGRFATFRAMAINLRTGRIVRDAFNGGDGSLPAPITDLELRPNGSMAWIIRISDTDGIRYEVRVGPRTLSPTQALTIDVGQDVDPRSLVLRGTTLYWTRGGVRRSTTLL